ncbi:hypothetical protein CH75_04675 [Dyella jiangningensis]|nr:hypothetical protein CH75_04675 [Dyella jiangningensis]
MTTMTLEQARQLAEEWGNVPMGHVHMPSEYLRRIRDAIDAHLAKSAQEWQPIETAPKDGSLVLLCTRSGNPRRICMAKYAEEGSSYPWRVDQTNYHLHTADLTYWMPLPAAPMLSHRGEVKGG